jgi:hypothetical protein
MMAPVSPLNSAATYPLFSRVYFMNLTAWHIQTLGAQVLSPCHVYTVVHLFHLLSFFFFFFLEREFADIVMHQLRHSTKHYAHSTCKPVTDESTTPRLHDEARREKCRSQARPSSFNRPRGHRLFSQMVRASVKSQTNNLG